MNGFLVKTLALNEMRLRMRRLSTVVATLAVIAVTWLMITDKSTGMTLIAVEGARVLYTSSCLALGSISLGGIFFGLGGFYLVRGRIGEDLRAGIGNVIAATPVGNASFIFSRWLGGMAYLGMLALAFMLTTMLLHAVRGDGPIELLVYLQTYLILMLPMLSVTVGMAILFDSVAWLMGKRGDVLYFFLWTAQMGLMAGLENTTGATPLLLLDFGSVATSIVALRDVLHTDHLSLGMGDFKAALAPVTLPAWMWSTELVMLRAGSGLLSLLPLLLAQRVFHRYSPDRVRVKHAQKRRSPLELANTLLRPLNRLVQPLYRVAADLPGVAGQVVADVALTLSSAPAALAVLVGVTLAALAAPYAATGPLVMGAVVFWGILVSGLATRDFEADLEGMSGAVSGGAARRYLRQYGATVLLGVMFTGVACLRWALHEPVRALALAGGILGLSACASLFGRMSRTARTFLALFLFAMYVSANVGNVAMIDLVGANGVASLQSAMAWLIGGALLLGGGYLYNRR